MVSFTNATLECRYGNKQFNSTFNFSANASSLADCAKISQELAINEVVILADQSIDYNKLEGPFDINYLIKSHTYVSNESQNIYVTNYHDSGVGSFREAINLSKLYKCKVNIIFKVETSGTITLLSNLETITNEVEINTCKEVIVILDCNNFNGLIFDFGSDKSILIGLTITNACNNGVTIKSSQIRLDRNNIILNKGNGILIEFSSNNIIGTNVLNNSNVKSNLISGNKENGIFLNNSNSNKIQNNFIGINENGISEFPNEKNGIYLNSSSNNIIGGQIYTNSEGQTNDPIGSPPIFIKLPLGNIISSNLNNGIFIDNISLNNSLSGNFIGTSQDGNNALGNKENGIFINNSSNNYVLGCSITTNPFVYYNVISSNKLNGIYILNSVNITIQGNFFGINSNNNTLLPNLNGIYINGCDTIQLGGPIPLGNIFSGNLLNGIAIENTSNFESYNSFVGIFAFGGAAPNGKDGIYISSKKKGNVLRTNVCSGNLGNGINLDNCEYISIYAIICGLDTKGKTSIPNGKNGILIQGESKFNYLLNTLESIIFNSVISGNNENGIAIIGNGNNNIITDVIIGLDIESTSSVGNILNGIFISGSASCNNINNCFVSGNMNDGILLSDKTANNVISSCQIGYSINDSSPNLNYQINSQSSTSYFINNTIYPLKK